MRTYPQRKRKVAKEKEIYYYLPRLIFPLEKTVLMIARRWENGDLEKLETNAEIAKYYSYGELCIGFCDICLYHLNSKLISKKDFDNYYSGLMNLVAKENQNYFEEIVKNPYCSRAFREWFARWNQKA